jgi:hypothetical protein
VDSSTDMAMAQRDLLAGCAAVIGTERARVQRQRLLESYRKGEVSDRVLLQSPGPSPNAPRAPHP